MANRILGDEDGLAYLSSPVNDAVTAINEAFDQCQVFVRFQMGAKIANNDNNVALGTAPIMDVKIAPNPFVGQTEIRISTPVDTPIRIELYDLDGSKLQTTFNDMIYADELNIINCEIENVGSARQVMCVIHTPYGVITKKMVVINR